MSEKGLTWWQELENVIEYWLIEKIVKWRGVSFIYWVTPDKWEEFIKESEELGCN